MSTVAEQLSAARKEHQMTVQQVAQITKLRTDHIRALESGNYVFFPAAVYIRGFVRIYAGLLELDISGILEQLDQELHRCKDAPQAVQFGDPKRGLVDSIAYYFSRINWKIVLPILGIFLAVVLLVQGIKAWKRYQARDPLAALGPGRYEPTQPDPSEFLPLPAPEDE